MIMEFIDWFQSFAIELRIQDIYAGIFLSMDFKKKCCDNS